MTPDYDVTTFETWRLKADEDFTAAFPAQKSRRRDERRRPKILLRSEHDDPVRSVLRKLMDRSLS